MRRDCKLARKALLFTATALLLAGGLSSAQAAADKYRLAWNNDPATTMTIGWCQDSDAVHYVQFGTSADPATMSREDVGTVSEYSNPVHGTSDILKSYFVDLDNLQPDTAYYFQVCEEGGSCGDTSWFKTAPDSPQPFTFIAGGDSRSNPEPRSEGNILISRIRPLFIAHGGDYLDDGTYDEWVQWLDEWQLTRSSDGRMYPVIPAHGNHENDVTNMVALIFNIPNEDGYSAFDIGGNLLRLYTLNTELEPGVGYSAFAGQADTNWNAQTDWLEADLVSNASARTWVITNYHRPLRPHRSSKPEGERRYDEWAPLFADHGVDLAIECDSHMVKYTFPVIPSSEPGSFEGFVRDDVAGTVYIGEGSWGAPTRVNDDDKPWTLGSDSFWQFNLVQVDSSAMTVRKVRFGSETEPYDPSGVADLAQSEQDADPFAMPAGLDLWQPLAGESLTIPFTNADVDNVRYVVTNDGWRYLDDGTYPGTDWREPGFTEPAPSAWNDGVGQLGYGDDDEDTVISYGPDENNKYITSYFRKTFTVNNPDAVIRLVLRLLYDDGAAVYLNGTEIARLNLPDGELTSSTLAVSSVGGASEALYHEMSIDPSLLEAGTNVIAVEVHQSSPTSSDLSFDLDLTGVESLVTGPSPAAPTNLEALALGPNDIELNWADNATDEVHYELQRKTGDGIWQILEPRLDKDTATYTNILLTEGQEYSYRVRCYNASGRSAYSNEVSVATLSNPIPVIAGYSWDFEDNSFGSLVPVSMTSDHNWEVYEYQGAHYARMNGYGADEPSDDWLITPALPLSYFSEVSLSFDSAYNYGGPELEVHVSTDYDPATGSGTWTQLVSGADFQLPQSGSYTFVNSGDVDLSSYSSEQTYIGFRYVSTGTGGGDGRVWEIDNIKVRGVPVRLLDVEPFDTDLGTWSAYSRSSTADWHNETRADQKGAFCNGYGADGPSDDWLISPAFFIDSGESAMLHFDYYGKYGGPMLEVYVSTTYPGYGDPLADGNTWDLLDIPLNSDIDDTWEKVEGVDLSSYSGNNVYVAFRYISTGSGPGDGRRWGVDNIGVSLMPPQPLSVNMNITPQDDFYTTAEPITFIASVYGGSNPYTYDWDFGNGEMSTEESPVYTYPAAGVFTVTVSVTDQNGEEQVARGEVEIVEVTEAPVPEQLGNLRIATFNILSSWNENAQGRLIEYLATPDWDHARKVAEIIQRVNPDVILLNEFDYDEAGEALANFKENYLEVSQNGAPAENGYFKYSYIAPSNTGIPSGVDLNNDGDTTDAEDAFGYGWYPGAYAMVVLSKHPIKTKKIRTFQTFLWKDMPGNLMPTDYYSLEAQEILRLSSKSHWDIPIKVNKRRVHILASHPTPPVFDGPEDRNGTRNHDEIRFWSDYVTPNLGWYIYDDNGRRGGLKRGEPFVILGDQNADPDEGDSTDDAILQLLDNPYIDPSIVPESEGSLIATGDADDTASWGMRADYVLPSERGLIPQQGQVFWPVRTDVNYHLIRDDISSDHRLVWLDLKVLRFADLDGDDDVDRDDIRIIKSYRRQPAQSCLDCDLNYDQKINRWDVKIAKAKCTRPNCKTSWGWNYNWHTWLNNWKRWNCSVHYR